MRIFKKDRKPKGFYSKSKAKRKKAQEAFKKRPDTPIGFGKAKWTAKTKHIPTTREKDIDSGIYYPDRRASK